MAKRSKGAAAILQSLNQVYQKTNIPEFKAGDTVKVHAKIVEGTKERVQIFQGVVISRKGRNGPQATFTVRKVSYNVGVERIFLVHSPRIEKIEVLTHGIVRRAKLFYLRDAKGKAARVKSKLVQKVSASAAAAAIAAENISDAETSEAIENSAQV